MTLYPALETVRRFGAMLHVAQIAALTATALVVTDHVAGSAAADLIKLNSGGELRGVVQSDEDESAPVEVRTLTGAVVRIRRDDVQFVARRSAVVEEYETRAKTVDDTVDARWALAEWCRLNRLEENRRKQLNRIVDLDPDHEQARDALDHVLHNGEWLPRAEHMQLQGYVLHRGRYITRQEQELIERSQEDADEIKEWRRRTRLWLAWLNGRNRDRQAQAVANLRDIRDPAAIPALVHHFQDHPLEDGRRLYVDVLSRIDDVRSVDPLVTQSLMDVDREIRRLAFEAIPESGYERAAERYSRELRSGLNTVVRRAASSLGRIGSERVIPQLVKALITTHRYRVTVEDNSGGYGFRTDGAFSLGGGQTTQLPPDVAIALRTGQLPFGAVVLDRPGPRRTRTVTVKYDHRNPEVLATLRQLTGADFGYDERTWDLWLKSGGTTRAG